MGDEFCFGAFGELFRKRLGGLVVVGFWVATRMDTGSMFREHKKTKNGGGLGGGSTHMVDECWGLESCCRFRGCCILCRVGKVCVA